MIPHRRFAPLAMAAMLVIGISCVREQKYDPEPSTVTEEDAQYNPVMTLVVNSERVLTISLTPSNDKALTDRQVRATLLDKAVDIYNASGKRRIRLTDEDAIRFAEADTISAPFQQMARGEWGADGLSVDDDLPVWLEAARSAANDTTLGPVAHYFDRMSQGAIAIRTAKDVPYVYMQQIFDLLQSKGFSNFALMTDLDSDQQ